MLTCGQQYLTTRYTYSEVDKMERKKESLIRFGKVKAEQQLIYDRTGQLIESIHAALHSYSQAGVQTEDETIDEQKRIIKDLKQDNMRKRMKATFYGATSNGKTTVVNALLGRELLPSGMADTTACFVQVEGLREHRSALNVDCGEGPKILTGASPSVDNANVQPEEPGSGTERGYVETKAKSYFCFQKTEQEEPERRLQQNHKHPLNVEKLEKLIHVGFEGSALDSTHILKIYLDDNETTCNLLRYDVQLMDCPGISKCEELKDRVNRFCEDSDVHVLIINGKNVITPEEKNHFVAVTKRLPRPDVIVGFTQWDHIAREKYPEMVKARHIDAVLQLFVDLDVSLTREEVVERCFFFSALEALGISIGEKENLLRGWEERHAAFEKFVSKIKERVTTTGMQSKLANGRLICAKVLLECERILHTCREGVKRETKQVDENIRAVKKQLSEFSKMYANFVEKCKELKDKALQDFEEMVCKRCEGIHGTFLQGLKRAPLEVLFEEARVRMYYEGIKDEFCQKVCIHCDSAIKHVRDMYDVSLEDSCTKLFRAFEGELSSANTLQSGRPVFTSLRSTCKSKQYSPSTNITVEHCMMAARVMKGSLFTSAVAGKDTKTRTFLSLVEGIATEIATNVVDMEVKKCEMEAQNEVLQEYCTNLAEVCKESSDRYKKKCKDDIDAVLKRRMDEEFRKKKILGQLPELLEKNMAETKAIRKQIEQLKAWTETSG